MTERRFAAAAKQVVSFMKHARIGILLLSGLLTACAPAPHLPDNWPNHQISLDQVNDDGGTGLVQVFIGYGAFVDNHAALRLVCPGKPTLMWDPGGNYGDGDPEIYARKHDYLIWEQAPDVKTFMEWRIKVPDVATEVFEFALTGAQAERLWNVLKNGNPPEDPRGRFTHRSAPMRCCTDTSDYLHRFAGDVLTVPQSYFWPRDLAKVLYTQRPRRVIYYRLHEPLRELKPPE